jgi:hypothetical protein
MINNILIHHTVQGQCMAYHNTDQGWRVILMVSLFTTLRSYPPYWHVLEQTHTHVGFTAISNK